MSSPFTLPADQTWQTLLDEITLAYSERRQALGQSAYTPSDSKDVQAATYWVALQLWLESYYGSFLDHVSGPLNPAGTAFVYFSLATWRSAASLNASGFRRVPEGVEWDGINDPVWSYGQMQAGDIIGPWIFEDLQKGLGALKWTIRAGAFTGTSKAAALNGGDQTDEHRVDLGWMKSAAEAEFNAAAPGATSTLASHARINNFNAGGGYLGYDVGLSRIYGTVGLSGLPAIAHSWKVYAVTVEVVWEPNYSSTHNSIYNTHGDFTYSPTKDIYSIIELGGESSDTSIAAVVGGTSHPNWPGDPGSSTSVWDGYATTALLCLLEWNFTNA